MTGERARRKRMWKLRARLWSVAQPITVCTPGSVSCALRPTTPLFDLMGFLNVVFKNTMKTANVADLRNDFQKIAAWISDGESVAIKKRGKLFATLTPAGGLSEPAMPKIDFAAQLKKIWGDKVFTEEEVREMRAAEQEGEDG